MDSQSFPNQVSKNCNSVLVIVQEKKDIRIARKEILSGTSWEAETEAAPPSSQ